MTGVQDFILSKTGKQQAILEYLDAVITEHPKVVSKIRYRVPFYYLKSWLCYLNPQKDGSVEFSFIRGNELADEDDLLEAKGRKQVKSTTFFDVEDIPIEKVKRILQEAFLLDETVPYASKRKKL